ncbi:protein mono-ADP-ribosyltransferase PARP11-like isoform X2 [Oreochromis aureus]|uniref:protein mono-ADP-ribosyltransferase PARP11-like isoform X2 n=1 Tax=Oreochromis aureus TaxID=47969 RepID=UPI001953208E|nr:protein mono-ADP-ribosyltransferase PARP11-like isoform X2 [Oreochromis aureus]
MGGNREVEYMDTSDTPGCWYYLADCERWHQFEDDPDLPFSSEAVEKFYLKNSKSVLNTSSFSDKGKIDFSAMLLTDLTARRQKRIKRSYNTEKRCSCFSLAPVFWESFDPDCPYQLIPLSEHSPEYQTVEHYVKTDGLLDRTILSIYRIQNLDLWELYCRKKKQLMRIQGIKEIQERRLFHGTDIKNVDYICKYNFDVRLAGQHGNIFGKGIYFAKHATYADKYSMRSSEPLPVYGGKAQLVHSGKTKIIFLARVVIGKPVAGRSHFQKPDHGSPENLHDSCVDDVSHPNIFVIFDPNQIYPEYVIQYS